MVKIPKHFYFRVHPMKHGTDVEIEDASDVDVVEAVRCKDCEHSENWYRDKRRCFLWSESGIGVFDDGFCNYAGRRIHEED